MSTVNLCDFYKTGHHQMYPDGLEMIFNNCTARGSRIKNVDHIVVFGIQYWIKQYLIRDFNETFFSQPMREMKILKRFHCLFKKSTQSSLVNLDKMVI